MSRPSYFSVGANLHALLAVSHLFAMEVDVAEMQHTAQNFEYRVLLLGREAQHLHGRQQSFEVLCVVLAVYVAVSTLRSDVI